MRRTERVPIMSVTAAGMRSLDADFPGVDRVPVPDLCCLWAEERATPMIIALVGTVEGGPLRDPGGAVCVDRVRRHIARRLHRAPMLRRMLLPTRLGQGPMAWTDVPVFDIAEHVVLAQPPGPLDEAGFLDWCA